MSPDLRKFDTKKSSNKLAIKTSESGDIQGTVHIKPFTSCFSDMKRNFGFGNIYSQRNVLPWTAIAGDGNRAQESAAAALLSLNNYGTNAETVHKASKNSFMKIDEFLNITPDRNQCHQPDVEDDVDIMDEETDIISNDEKSTTYETKKSLASESIQNTEDGDDGEKPNQSYISLIANAILATRDKRLVLSDIYNYVLEKYPYFRNKGPGWRNSIRHNLSLNECFIKAGRSPNGKGHFWAINPANFEDFSKGDFRRRRAQRRARRSVVLQQYGTAPCGVVNAPFCYDHPYLNRQRPTYFDGFRNSHLPMGISSILNPDFHLPSNMADIVRKTRNTPKFERPPKKQKTGFDVESLLRKEDPEQSLCSNHGTTSSKIFTPVACHPHGAINVCSSPTGCSHWGDINLPNRHPSIPSATPCSCYSRTLDKPFPLNESRSDSSCPNGKLTFPFVSALLRNSINELRY